MPAPTLFKEFVGSMTDHVSRWNNNFTAIEAALVDIYQQLLAVAGEGARLILDAFDRPGIVGSASYQLDLDSYSGGALIAIGRRPPFQVGLGESNTSVAWINTGTAMQRVEQAGDVVLNAGVFQVGLPKQIFVGTPSSGAAQFYGDTLTPGVLYIYEMTWDGFNLTNFRRRGTILPGFTALQDLASAPRVIQIFDPDTDFVSDILGSTAIPLHGARDDNGIDVDGSMEVLGFFAAFAKNGPDGMFAPGGPDNLVRFKVMCDGLAWTETDFAFDCSMLADEQHRKVHGSIGDQKFVTTVRRFSLERTYKGAHVASARGFTWGLLVRPLIGAPVPKDQAKVVMI